MRVTESGRERQREERIGRLLVLSMSTETPQRPEGPKKVKTKKKQKDPGDLAELSRLKRCQDTGEVTAAANCLHKKAQDEHYDWLAVLAKRRTIGCRSGELVFQDAANKEKGDCKSTL